MRLLLGVLLCLARSSSGGWLRDFLTPRGWQIGDGLVLHLINSRYPNSTFLERRSILLSYGGYGVSLGKIPSKRAVEVGLYTPDMAEGRSDDGGGDKSYGASISVIIGYKVAAIVTLAISLMGAFVFKALIAAKLALVLSTALLVSKIFHHHHGSHHSMDQIELDHAPSEIQQYVQLGPSGGEYYPAGSAAYYSYLHPSIDYSADSGATASSPDQNSTLPATPGNQQVARRRDATRRKLPLFMIRQYTVKS